MKCLRILVADDHDIMRRGLRTLLESHSDWSICAEARTGNEAVAKSEEFRPDIAILDIKMPELNGAKPQEKFSKLLQTRKFSSSQHTIPISLCGRFLTPGFAATSPNLIQIASLLEP